MRDSVGCLLMAVDGRTGRIIHFDITPQTDRTQWDAFLGLLSDLVNPLGIVHPGHPVLEEALGIVFTGVPRQLCIKHFLSALYQYLRSFQMSPLGPGTVEMRFYRAVSQCLKAGNFKQALMLYQSLKTNPEFATDALDSPLRWFQERFPLLTTHYVVEGMPSEGWLADRAISEIVIRLRTSQSVLERPTALKIIRAHWNEMEKLLGDQAAARAHIERASVQKNSALLSLTSF